MIFRSVLTLTVELAKNIHTSKVYVIRDVKEVRMNKWGLTSFYINLNVILITFTFVHRIFLSGRYVIHYDGI